MSDHAEQLLNTPPWIWSDVLLPGGEARRRPPENHVSAVRALLGSGNEEDARRAAILLAVWGEEDGARWWLDFVNRGQDAHKFEVAASILYYYGRAGGSRELEASVYRRLINLAPRQQMTKHLWLALSSSPALAMVSDEVVRTAISMLEEGNPNGACFLPALALLDPTLALEFVDRCLDQFTDSEGLLVNGYMLVQALVCSGTVAATIRARELSASLDENERRIGQDALEEIEERALLRRELWWQLRWEPDASLHHVRLMALPLDAPRLRTFSSALWGHGDARLEARMEYLIEHDIIDRTISKTAVEAIFAEQPAAPDPSRAERLLEAWICFAHGLDYDLSVFEQELDAMLEGAAGCLYDFELGAEHDGTIGLLVSHAFLRSRRAGDWAYFERTARTVLERSGDLDIDVELGAALYDAKCEKLGPLMLDAYRRASAAGRSLQASFLLPAIVKHAMSDEVWPLLEATLTWSADATLHPAVFASLALRELPCPRSRALLEQLDEHEVATVSANAMLALEYLDELDEAAYE